MRRFLAAALLVLLSAPLAQASFINYSSREINVKVVYYGPGTGLSENLQYIYGKTSPEAKGKMIKLATETEDVLFFDFLPLSLGEIRGFKTRFHLYTVPGNVGATANDYSASRKLILKGVDGVVFVASADPAHAKANVISLMALRTSLAEQGYDYEKIPLVFQIANTHVKSALPASDVAKTLLVGDHQVFEADPVGGTGVFDSLKAIAKLILMELKKGAEEAPAVTK
jgi:mutual gliding-motility protein MglA